MRKYNTVIIKEAEMSSKVDTKLYKMALQKVIKERNDWLIDMIRSMNPKRLSPADIDMLHDILMGGVS